MNPFSKRFLILLMAPALCAWGQVPEDSDLYRTILAMDAAYFKAYNDCDLETQARLLSDDLEFYHDQGGLSTSKPEIINSIAENICGKVTRNLVEGSVEVHEIRDFGAVEIGYHTFFNKQEPEAKPKPSRFITIWKQEGPAWKMYRVVSLH